MSKIFIIIFFPLFYELSITCFFLYSRDFKNLLKLYCIMKKLMIVLVTMTFISTAFAHSGGTNSAGCHKDTKRGTYHCH